VSFLYFASIIAVVVINTSSIANSNAIVLFESILDLLHSISEGTFSFLFSLLMNFVLLFFIFCLNLSSAVIAELISCLNDRRSGGRGNNELELNSLAITRGANSNRINEPQFTIE
jgi:hypothetical protein